MTSSQSESEHLPKAHAEAQGLLALLKQGASVESVRLLIQVSPAEEKTLRIFAEENPLAGQMFLAVIDFRRRVLQQFDRLTAHVSAR